LVSFHIFALFTNLVAAGGAANQQEISPTDPISFDCKTRLPVGRSKSEAQTGSLPPLSVLIGNNVIGQIKYKPGVPLPIKISYRDGQVLAVFIKAESLFGLMPVGSWIIEAGDVKTFSCSSSSDSIVGTSFGKEGSINLYWISPFDFTDYIEIQITVIGPNGLFWLWNSFLLEAQ